MSPTVCVRFTCNIAFCPVVRVTLTFVVGWLLSTMGRAPPIRGAGAWYGLGADELPVEEAPWNWLTGM